MARIITTERCSQILDIGTGTGYVARSIDALLPFKPQWTLLDRDEARTNVAFLLNTMGARAKIVCCETDLFLASTDSACFDCAVICFTLLEFPDYNRVINAVSQTLTRGGILLIVIPDPWEEAVKDNVLAVRLLNQRLQISKIDKFTGQPYPYHVSRVESVMLSIMTLGFSLQSFVVSSKTSPVFVMAFRKEGV